MSAAAPPPPPGPPPLQPDLDAVYRPDEDPALKGSYGARTSRATEAFVFGDQDDAPAVPAQAHLDLLGLGGALEQPRTGDLGGAQQSSTMSLIDLDDSSAGAPSDAGAAGAEGSPQGGLLTNLPVGVQRNAVESAVTFIDLSAPQPPQQETAAAAPAAPGTGAAGATLPGVFAAGARTAGVRTGANPTTTGLPVIPDSQAFGSDDVFGRGEERNLAEELKGEAVAAWSSVVRKLPEEVKVQIPDCMAPPPEDPNLELNFSGDARFQQQGAQGLPAQAAAPLTALSEAGGMNQAFAAQAVNRACEGRWVPTYMRQQMVQNGHTNLPSAPNAHEYNAGSHLPSVHQTLNEMGSDMTEQAQTAVAFVIAFLSSLATQFQMCTAQTATTMHDQVITFGENMCSGATGDDNSEEQVGMVPLSEEHGYGPMRSRVMRTIQGVGFERLIGLMKTQFAGAALPQELQRIARGRAMTGHKANHDCGTEDMVFSTDVNMDAVPHSALQHVCVGYGPLTCRETWIVQHFESRASIEISNAPTSASVTVCVRVDVVGSPDGNSCEVDSRLFAKPREAHVPLPLGLVEQLTEAHHLHSESLRDMLMAFVQREAFESVSRTGPSRDAQEPPAPAPAVPSSSAPSAAAAAIAAEAAPSGPGGPPCAAQASSNEQGLPASCGAARQAPEGPSALQVASKVRGDGTQLDASLLMKMAEGI